MPPMIRSGQGAVRDSRLRRSCRNWGWLLSWTKGSNLTTISNQSTPILLASLATISTRWIPPKKHLDNLILIIHSLSFTAHMPRCPKMESREVHLWGCTPVCCLKREICWSICLLCIWLGKLWLCLSVLMNWRVYFWNGDSSQQHHLWNIPSPSSTWLQ